MIKRNDFRLAFATPIAAVILGMPVTAGAQDNVLEEIVVTAQKREQALQDTPLAITAFSGEELDRAGVLDAFNLTDMVPNLHVGTEDSRDAILITIRGVAQVDRRNTSDPTTAFHVDGTYIPRMSGIAAYFYDLERLEVLRGPQGTLYGRNSTSGVVNVITNKPNFDGFSVNGDVSFGNYEMMQVKGALNIPISDRVAARVAFINNDRNGFSDNGPLVTDGDDADELGVRAHLLWNFTDDTSLLLTGDYYLKQGVGPVSADFDENCAVCNVPVVPGDAQPLDTQGFRDNQDRNFKWELNHSFGNFDAIYLGAWRNHERDYLIDGGNDFDGDVVVEVHDSKSWQHEIRLSSRFDGPLNFILGGYYLDEEINGTFNFSPENFDGMTGMSQGDFLNVFFPDKDFTSESTAAFFNGTYAITDDLTLTAGVRWTRDEKDKGGINDPLNPTAGSHFIVGISDTQGVDPDAIFLKFFTLAQVSNPSWNETTWKVGLDWRINDDTLGYATISTGYKSGGFNRGSNDPDQPSGSPNVANLVVYNPEFIDAYEVGLKTTFADGRARLNAAAFYYDYEDNQQAVVRVIGGIPTNTTINAAAATIWGAELEGTLLFGNGGSAALSLGYLDTEFDEFVGLDDPQTAGQDDLDVAGNELINAPDVTATLTLIPTVWDTEGGGTVTPRLQFHYEADAWLRVHNFPQDKRDSYTKTDASLRYDSGDGRWYADVWVRNIEDDRQKASGNCTSVNGTLFPGAPNPLLKCNTLYTSPLTYGLTFGFRME